MINVVRIAIEPRRVGASVLNSDTSEYQSVGGIYDPGMIA